MDAETDASYSEAGFGRETPWGQAPAVLVVDMCQAYFTAHSPLFLDRPQVVSACIDLVEAARRATVPVVWTRVEYEPGGADGGVWYQKVPALRSFDRGNPLGEWVPGLEPTQGERVTTKQHASGFAGTNLEHDLHAAGIDTLLICGVSTSGCVRATATDASSLDFLPFVVEEAVGDRTDAVQKANLFDLNAKYADVISLADCIERLNDR